MPIYEYECDGCHEVFAVRQKISDPAPETHGCGSTQIRRILSATTFVLKGTGWYKTDYADKERGKPAGGVPDSDSNLDATKGDHNSENKPSADASAGTGTEGAKSGAQQPQPTGGHAASNKTAEQTSSSNSPPAGKSTKAPAPTSKAT